MNKDSHSPTNPPFWIEAPQNYYHVSRNNTPGMRVVNIGIIVFLGAAFLQIIFSVFSFVPFPISAICGAGFIFISLIAIVPTYLMNSKRKADYLIAMDSQENAKHKIGASMMGSATHVAGHPSLERDQPIALAITDDSLDFYSFDSSTALVKLGIDDIDAVKTVVYDDERVPHIEVVDSAAQALQIEFELNGKECAMLLRAMKQIRPIDWYHAIQQARFS